MQPENPSFYRRTSALRVTRDAFESHGTRDGS